MVSFRNSDPSDHGFIFNSWLKSLWDSHKLQKGDYKVGEKNNFFQVESLKCNRIFMRSRCIIMCDETSPDYIYGYCVYEQIEDIPVVHFIYLKRPFRRMGLSKKLLHKIGINDQENIIASYENSKSRSMKTWKQRLILAPKLREI